MEISEMLRKRSTRLTTLLLIATLLSVAILSRPALALVSQNSKAWFWVGDTNVASMATGDVDGDGGIEVVTGGYYHDGVRWTAQLVVWNGSTLAAEKIFSWYWIADTQIASVAIGDVDGDGGNEIVTGGAFFDGTRWNAQLVVWNGSTLAVERIFPWRWISDTQVASVAVGDVDGDGGVEIVTGGTFFDGTRYNAQLVVWNGSTLAAERVVPWFWVSNTYIANVAVGNFSGSTGLDVITAGRYNDGTRNNAQVIDWNGATMGLNSNAAWFWISDTEANSVAMGDFGAGNRVIAGGSYSDLTRSNAQLTVWG
jgi:hypothetical protein